jgi:2-aminoethylphosphonate-pyruvate transaminase
VQAFYALDEALDELRDAGGWRARQARYRSLAGRVRAELAALGVEPLLPADRSSCVLAAFGLPSGLSYETLHDRLKRDGFVIYAGQGRLADRIFRIAVMGAIGDADLDRLLQALRSALG